VRHPILFVEPITAQKIIEIHTDIIRDFGGASGIRDDATLD
jgi:prophage maintenance system killer protein